MPPLPQRGNAGCITIVVRYACAKGSAVAQVLLVLLVLQVGPAFTQMEKVPLLLFPYSQNLIYTVLPGVSPVWVMEGIRPLALRRRLSQ